MSFNTHIDHLLKRKAYMSDILPPTGIPFRLLPHGVWLTSRISPLPDRKVTIHTDTLNESCSLEGSVAAFKGRSIHTYHSEGAGGGHAPDIIAVCGEPKVIPSSTNPTR